MQPTRILAGDVISQTNFNIEGVNKIVFNGSGVSCEVDTTPLLNALQYSGLSVTKDMSYEEICEVLAEAFPKVVPRNFIQAKPTYSIANIDGHATYSELTKVTLSASGVLTAVMSNIGYGSGSVNAMTVKSAKVDLTNYSSLEFSAVMNCNSVKFSSSYPKAMIYLCNSAGSIVSTIMDSSNYMYTSQGTYSATIDISHLKGEHYLHIYLNENSNTTTVTINKHYLK